MIQIIQWNTAYSVGNEEIDNQHKQLINILNLIKVAYEKGQAKEAQKYIIQDMMEYSIEHFSTEETLLGRQQYPYLTQHKEEHAKYISAVNAMYNESSNLDLDVSYKILEFLNQWWIDHILTADKDYASFLGDS